jgi:hypothetical protein
MARKVKKDETGFRCPIGNLFMKMEGIGSDDSPIARHLSRAAYEILQAVRSIAEDGISRLDPERRKPRKKRTKIEVS